MNMDYELKLLVLKKEFQKMERCFKILELCYHNGEFIDTQEDKEVVSEIITRTLSALNELIAVLKNGLALADEHEAITPEMFDNIARSLKTIGQALYEVNMRMFNDVLVGLDKVKDYYEDYEDYDADK